MKKMKFTAALCCAASVPSLALAQNAATLVPLSTFGVNGYVAPGGTNADVTTGTNERGLAFNPLGVYDSAASAQYGGGDLYTTLTGGTIGILSAATGALEGTLGSASTYTGGTFAIDSIAVAADGAIYVNNLTTNSSTSNYKIYRYANEAAGTGSSPVGPTVAFSGSVGPSRVGDDLAVYGTGTSTVLASGFGAPSNGSTVQNGYAIIPITGPTGNTTSTAVQVSGVSGHDFSSTLTFGANANTILGSSAQIPGSYHDSTYVAGNTTGTLVGDGSLTAVNSHATLEHLLAYDVVDGVPILAAQSTGDSHVSIYDDTNPLSPVLLAAANAPAVPAGDTNANGTGQVVFGSVYNTNQVNLYTLSTGEGIAAYTITIVHNLTYLNANGNFDTAISPSFNGSSGPSVFHTGDNVTFDDSFPTGPYTVPISGTVSPSSTTFNNSLGNYVVTGANSSSGIAGAGSLTKFGTGSVTLSSSNSYTGGTVVNAGTLTFGSANAFPVNTSLNIASGAMVTIANHSSNAVFVPQLSSLINNGTIDITNNALLVHNGAIGTINAEVAQAYANGTWTGTNASGGVITSSIAAGSTSHLTAVGVATNLSTFEGLAVASTDVLVKYTYYGDALLTGSVTSADYTQIDAGFLSQNSSTPLTGWQNGDFNYDNVINGSDYTLIDNAFNTQGAQISTELATATAQIAGSAPVPEPTSLGLIGVGAMGLLGRRRRV
jgi:autotransporter-associated beta strand protein